MVAVFAVEGGVDFREEGAFSGGSKAIAEVLRRAVGCEERFTPVYEGGECRRHFPGGLVRRCHAGQAS